MSSSIPPVTPGASPGDGEPGSPPSLPDLAVWSDSSTPGEPPATGGAFAGLVSKPSDNPLPTIGHIGRYALKYRLGEGGLGTVYAAHDPLLSRLIAVKTLNLTIEDSERESFNALFLNEARAAGGLSHPHIVTVFDAGVSDKRAYIAMELLKGRDLRQLRQEGWRATPAQAALIVRRVADALAFAHSKGVIHRDVKPANIFMVGRTQPRVLDFGIARVAHKQDQSDTLLGAGSPYYMAPEQFRRDPADRRADVFSLGVVLYELLTDTRPFRGDSLQEIANAVLVYEPPPADKVDPSVPRALADIASRAMAKDPDQRFRSARSFARELRQWLDDNPTGPEGDLLTATATARAPSPRPVRKWLAIAAASLAIGAGSVVAAAAWLGLLPGHDDAATAAAVALPTPTPTPTPMTRVQATGAEPAVAAGPAFTPASAAPAAAVAAPLVADAANATPVPLSGEAADRLLLSTLTGIAPGAAAKDPNTARTLEPATAAPATPAAAVALPSSPPAATVAPATAAPSPAATKEPLRDRRAREARDREARERELRLAAEAAAAVPAATGTVRIAVSPWGEVEVDGTRSGAAPPLADLKLTEGRHTVVLRNGDFAPHVVTINVVAGQTVTLRHRFGS